MFLGFHPITVAPLAKKKKHTSFKKINIYSRENKTKHNSCSTGRQDGLVQSYSQRKRNGSYKDKRSKENQLGMREIRKSDLTTNTWKHKVQYIHVYTQDYFRSWMQTSAAAWITNRLLAQLFISVCVKHWGNTVDANDSALNAWKQEIILGI